MSDSGRNPLQLATDAEIVAAIKDKHYTYYAIWAGRSGGLALISTVEYHFFHPRFGPASNDEFKAFTKEWRGLKYFIFGVPKSYDAKVRHVADVLGLRPADGVPAELVPMSGQNSRVHGMVSARIARDVPRMRPQGMNIEFFPGAAEAELIRKNFFTIENSRGSSSAYRNRPDLTEEVHKREGKICDGLMRLGPSITVEQVRDYVWYGMIPGVMQTKQ